MRGGYRFGFQGQEADNKIGGLGQHLNYTFRNYDSWIIRFGAIDPLAAKYAYWSPFAFSGNRVIDAVELEGLEFALFGTAGSLVAPRFAPVSPALTVPRVVPRLGPPVPLVPAPLMPPPPAKAGYAPPPSRTLNPTDFLPPSIAGTPDYTSGLGVRSPPLRIEGYPYDPNKKVSPWNYPIPDLADDAPPVLYHPQTTEEWANLKRGDSPNKGAGDDQIEAHHRNQEPVRDGGVLDEIAKGSHRGTGIHGQRHTKPSKLTPQQRKTEIKNHYENRAKDYKDSDFDDCGNIKPGVAERVNKKYGVK